MMGIKVRQVLAAAAATVLSLTMIGSASAGALQYPVPEDTEVILRAPIMPEDETAETAAASVELPLPVSPEAETPISAEPELEKPDALTPEGNLTLVDDVTAETEENKQFLTVVTKAGNYFYLVIDRTSEGENTVHFLNQVDEEDLLALIETEDKAETPIVCACVEKCAIGSINTDCELCMMEMVRCVGEEPEPAELEKPEEPEEPEEPEKKNSAGPLLLLLLLLAAGGGAAFYFLILKPKRKPSAPDPLEDYDPDEEYEEEM